MFLRNKQARKAKQHINSGRIFLEPLVTDFAVAKDLLYIPERMFHYRTD